jgi:hypothetical protein
MTITEMFRCVKQHMSVVDSAHYRFGVRGLLLFLGCALGISAPPHAHSIRKMQEIYNNNNDNSSETTTNVIHVQNWALLL